EETAFAELMQRHRHWVGSLVRAFVRDREQAEDLTQEVFCRVHRRAANYAAQGRFTAWLKRIAVNIARDALRQQQPARLVPLHERETEAEPEIPFDPTAALMSAGLREELRAAIQALPEEQ